MRGRPPDRTSECTAIAQPPSRLEPGGRHGSGRPVPPARPPAGRLTRRESARDIKIKKSYYRPGGGRMPEKKTGSCYLKRKAAVGKAAVGLLRLRPAAIHVHRLHRARHQFVFLVEQRTVQHHLDG